MGEGGQAGMVKRRDQNAGGDADRFLDVVVFHAAAVTPRSVFFRENDDEVGRCFQKRFVGVGTEWRQGLQPVIRGAVSIELPFLRLCATADLAFQGRIADHAEVPWLAIGSRRRTARAEEALFDDLP